jgi:hypothetical protein
MAASFTKGERTKIFPNASASASFLLADTSSLESVTLYQLLTSSLPISSDTARAFVSLRLSGALPLKL